MNAEDLLVTATSRKVLKTSISSLLNERFKFLFFSGDEKHDLDLCKIIFFLFFNNKSSGFNLIDSI